MKNKKLKVFLEKNVQYIYDFVDALIEKEKELDQSNQKEFEIKIMLFTHIGIQLLKLKGIEATLYSLFDYRLEIPPRFKEELNRIEELLFLDENGEIREINVPEGQTEGTSIDEIIDAVKNS